MTRITTARSRIGGLAAASDADRPDRSTRDATADGDVVGTALIADDESEMRDVFRLWLAAEGWTVREASDGRQALEKLDGTVDVLVTDREMPNCSGREVVDRLGETAFDGDVIVVSGRRPDARLDGDDVTGYVTKPVTREEFVTHLEAVDR